jgi:hypothetical protein
VTDFTKFERLTMPTKAPPKRETWENWIPPGWFGPTDEELITRDELLDRVRELGADIHPRTLQIMEKDGLVPRPIRRWHGDAVRAIYAPWVVELVIRAYLHRRKRWSLEEAQADMREAVKSAIAGYSMDTWGGHGIPLEFVSQLHELAQRQAEITGSPVPSAEVRFFDADGRTIATIRKTFTEEDERLRKMIQERMAAKNDNSD